MPAQITVLVLRHGRSEWNAVRRWQGRFDSPLDHVGRSQAAAVAERLAGLGRRWHTPTASTLGRAAETAAIISGRLGLGAPRLDTRLVEAHAGAWQGMTPDQIEAEYPGWLAEHRRPDDFESYDAVVDRATAALVDVAASTAPGATALVVSHSGLIRSMVRSLGVADTRIPNLGGAWFRVSTTAGTGVDFDGLYDPGGVVVSGVDAPGEDPGEQPDQSDHHRRSDR